MVIVAMPFGRRSIVALAPPCPDFAGEEIDENEIKPGRILMLQMLLEVLSGNDGPLRRDRAQSAR